MAVYMGFTVAADASTTGPVATAPGSDLSHPCSSVADG